MSGHVLVQRKNLCCATESAGRRAMFFGDLALRLKQNEDQIRDAAFCCLLGRHPSAVKDLHHTSALVRSCKISFARLKSSPLVSSGS